MPRAHRTFASGVAYHVISRGSGKAAVFRDPSDYETYLQMLLDTKKRFGVEVFHYVLMPNHVHLLLRTSKNNGPEFMWWLNMHFAKYICKKRKKIGHVWKSPFKNIPIGNDSYLLACGNYIEMNPVRGNIVADPIAWPYSSYRFYAAGKPDPLIDVNPLYVEFGNDAQKRMAAYQKWIGKTRASS